VRALLATLLAVALLAVPAPLPATVPTQPAVDNTVIIYDVYGQRLDAHDGGLIDGRDGWVYSYGTSYGCGFSWQTPGAPYCGIRVYRTHDLRVWEPAGSFLGIYAFNAGSADWQALCDGSSYGCFSPTMVWNPNTSRFVLWVNTPDGYRAMDSASPRGPFVNVTSPTLNMDRGGNHEGLRYGDPDVFMDGTACYLMYTVIGSGTSNITNAHDLAVTQLDSTCRDAVGAATLLGLTMAEGPGAFRGADGKWYVTYSAPACPYCGTGLGVMDAPSPMGPWAHPRLLAVDGCRGQGSDVSVITSPSGALVWVQSIDRWDSPANGVPGARNQARANNYWGRLTFTANGGTAIDAYACQPTWTL